MNTRDHYVDNNKFIEVLNQHKKNIKYAEKHNLPKPRTPEYIGYFFTEIATRLATKADYAGYSFKESMISDGIFTCLPGYVKIETEHGFKTIKEIVDTKYSGKVLSMSQEGKLEWNKIIGHRAINNNYSKTWVTIKPKLWGKSALVCTQDHMCSIVRNPLKPIIEYTESENLPGHWMVRKLDKNVHNHPNKIYNQEQLSFLVGTLLGDASIDHQGSLVITHCLKQQEYLKLKQNIFNGKIIDGIQGNTGYSPGTPFKRLIGPVNAQTKVLRKLCYTDQGKTIKPIIDYIDEKSLAFWYMDDGTLCFYKKLNKHFIQIATQGFSYEDCYLLKELLYNKWNLKVSINKDAINTKGFQTFFLRMGVESSSRFFDMIAKYVPECMKYKLSEKFRNYNPHVYNTIPLEYTLVEIEEVRPIHPSTRSKLYDITVENNHNFFANNMLVHNCILYYLNYDPKKNPSGHPFAYFTTIIRYAFWRRIEIERKQQYIKCKAFQASELMSNLNLEDNPDLPDDLKEELSQNIKTYENITDFIHVYETNQEKKKIKAKNKKSLTTK